MLTLDSRANQTVTTTDNSTTTLATIPIPAGSPISLMDFAFEIRAKEAATGDCRIQLLRGTIKRVGAGAAALVGATTGENRRDGGAATWGATASASGNNLLLQVSGQNGKTIVWNVVEKSTI